MAAPPSIVPVVGFDYSGKPTKNTWTLKYVTSAFGPGHRDTILELFTRASELVEEHDIRLSAFSGHRNSRLALKGRRDEIALVLERELGSAIQIAENDSFAGRLCRSVLTYQASHDVSATVREELREVVKRHDHNANLKQLTDQTDPSSASMRSSLPLEPPQPEVTPLTTLPEPHFPP